MRATFIVNWCLFACVFLRKTMMLSLVIEYAVFVVRSVSADESESAGQDSRRLLRPRTRILRPGVASRRRLQRTQVRRHHRTRCTKVDQEHLQKRSDITTGPGTQNWVRNTFRKGQSSPPDQTHKIGLEICFESWSGLKNGS